jgi:methionyl-tRNA formyltransferase
MQEIGKRFRVAFLGRGELGARVLEALLTNTQIEVPVVFTCRSSPEVGFDESHFERIAEQNGIPFFQSNNINKPEWISLLSRFKPDLAVAMLWVNTIGDEVIRTSRLGFLNCHGGMLPRYRGNACSNWAILNGEKEVGLTIHLMEPGKLDSGPIVIQDKIPISDTTTIRELTDTFTERGAELVIEAVELMRTGTAELRPQDESRSLYCYPRLPRDGEIDWNKSAADVLTLIRAAGDPYPGAYSYFADVRDHRRLKKLVIDKASIETHPGDFCAVPGHLLKLAAGSRRAVVCGDMKLLVLERVRVDGASVDPAEFFRSVRQRLGLDTEILLAEVKRHANDDPHAVADQFLRGNYVYVENLCQSVDSVVEPVAEQLQRQFACVELNPLKNYSFQKRFYDWEQRERWFGIQIYRSLRFTRPAGEPLALGYWLFSEDGQGLRQRIFISIKSDYAHLYSARIAQLAADNFEAAQVFTGSSDRGNTGSCFVDVTGADFSTLQARMLKIGREIILLGNDGADRTRVQ